MIEDLKKINKEKSQPEVFNYNYSKNDNSNDNSSDSNSLNKDLKKEESKYQKNINSAISEDSIKEVENHFKRGNNAKKESDAINNQDEKNKSKKEDDNLDKKSKKDSEELEEELEKELEKEIEEEIKLGDIIMKPNFSEKIRNFFNKKKKNNLDLLETDLIKDEIEIRFDWSSNLAAFFLLFIIAFIVVAEACVFFSWWGESKETEGTNYLESEIAYINNQIEEMKPEYNEAIKFSNLLRLSAGALDRHIYWTNFFTLLENNTLKNIYYRNFSGDISGKYVLPAVSNNVLAISYQSKVFSSNEMVLSTEVSDENIINSVGEDEVEKSIINFNFNLNLNDRIFKD